MTVSSRDVRGFYLGFCHGRVLAHAWGRKSRRGRGDRSVELGRRWLSSGRLLERLRGIRMVPSEANAAVEEHGWNVRPEDERGLCPVEGMLHRRLLFLRERQPAWPTGMRGSDRHGLRRCSRLHRVRPLSRRRKRPLCRHIRGGLCRVRRLQAPRCLWLQRQLWGPHVLLSGHSAVAVLGRQEVSGVLPARHSC